MGDTLDATRAASVLVIPMFYAGFLPVKNSKNSSKYQNSFEILHIMEKCYAIIGRVAPLMDAFFGVPARKHTYSDINSFFVARILYRC